MLFQRRVKYYSMIFLQNLQALGLRMLLTDRLNLGELQVDDVSAKIRYRRLRNIYQSGKLSFK